MKPVKRIASSRELLGSSHVFASVSGKLNRMDVTGEKPSSARRHIWGSQEKQANIECSPPKNTLIPVAANSPNPWRDDAGLAGRTRKLHSEKALATRGFEPLLSVGPQC